MSDSAWVIVVYLRSLERVSIPADSSRTSSLLGLEKQDCAVTQVEIDEVLGLCESVSMHLVRYSWPIARLTVCDEAAEVPSDNAMPCCALPLVELKCVSTRCQYLIMLRRTVRLMW